MSDASGDATPASAASCTSRACDRGAAFQTSRQYASAVFAGKTGQKCGRPAFLCKTIRACARAFARETGRTWDRGAADTETRPTTCKTRRACGRGAAVFKLKASRTWRHATVSETSRTGHVSAAFCKNSPTGGLHAEVISVSKTNREGRVHAIFSKTSRTGRIHAEAASSAI
jgi:hypothetical protein